MGELEREGEGSPFQRVPSPSLSISYSAPQAHP